MERYTFLYTRRSSEEDDRQTLSLDAQKQECESYATARSITFDREIAESHSARKPGRPLFETMLQDIRALRDRGVQVQVLCHKPDRLLRNLGDWAKINDLMDSGVEFLFVSGTYPNNAQGKMAFGINVLFAKYYVDNLSEEVRKGLRQKLARGEWPGWAPLGYLNVSDKAAPDRVVLDPIRAPLVRRAFEYYASGEYSLERLAEKLHQEGLSGKRLGKRLSKTYLQERILMNPFYCGLMHYNDKLYQGAHPALISIELFEAVAQIMHGHSRPRKMSREHRYRGVFRCAHCGSAVVGEVKKGRYRYYRCIHKRSPCPAGYIREHDVEQWLKEAISATISLRPQVKAALIAAAEVLAGRQAREDERGPALQAQQKELERKVTSLLDLRLAGHITDAEYAAKRKQLVVEQTRIRQQLERVELHQPDPRSAVDWFVQTCDRVETVFEHGRDEEIRQFLRIVGSNYQLRVNSIDFEPVEPFFTAAQVHNRPQWCGAEDEMITLVRKIMASFMHWFPEQSM